MGLLPSEKDIENAEDHLGVVLAESAEKFLSTLEALLNGYEVRITLEKKGTPK